MVRETGYMIISFTDIPAKFSDVLQTDFCAFEHLRNGLSKRRPTILYGLWKSVQIKWN